MKLSAITKKVFLAVLAIIFSFPSLAQKRNVYRGFDGGMMLHTGYLYGTLPPTGYVSGAPFGIGGTARVHLGSHWRLGFEGYVSTLSQFDNGSYIKYGWGGFLADFYWQFGRFFPYAGLTVGGGANKNLIIKGKAATDWQPLEKAYLDKQKFVAIAPFVGCDYAVSDVFHLTLKADWLNCISRDYPIPTGPRLYFGFIFYH